MKPSSGGTPPISSRCSRWSRRQILFASDIPYGRTTAGALVLRAALVAEQIAIVAGGQLERLLAGAEPLDLGPAPTAPAPGPGPALMRLHTLLVTAAARLTTGYPAAEYVELARLACELPAGHANAIVGQVDTRPDRQPPRHIW